LPIVDSQAVKNTCTASVNSKKFCHYKSTNAIKRHLAVDTQGFPFFTYCTPANVSDDLSLIELLSHNLDYFRALAGQYPEDYHPAGQRVSPGYNHRSSAKGIYANPDQDSVPNSPKANQSRKSSARKISICPGGDPLGD